jgi:hypothetical protein
VAVNQVKLGGVLEHFRYVAILGHFRIDCGILFVSLINDSVQVRASHGVRGGE